MRSYKAGRIVFLSSPEVVDILIVLIPNCCHPEQREGPGFLPCAA